MDKNTISAVMREMGRKGGKAKVAKGFAALSPEERQKIAKKAVRARRAKKKTTTVLIAMLLVLGFGLPRALAVDPAPLPPQIREAKVVYVTAQGIELGTMDVVYDELKKWGRWTLVDEPSHADLVVVLSSQNYYAGMISFGSGSATASATTYGNTTTAQANGSSQRMAIPIFRQTRFLTLVDRRSGASLLSLSCRHREINGDSRTGRTLVNELKGRFPKNER